MIRAQLNARERFRRPAREVVFAFIGSVLVDVWLRLSLQRTGVIHDGCSRSTAMVTFPETPRVSACCALKWLAPRGPELRSTFRSTERRPAPATPDPP